LSLRISAIAAHIVDPHRTNSSPGYCRRRWWHRSDLRGEGETVANADADALAGGASDGRPDRAEALAHGIGTGASGFGANARSVYLIAHSIQVHIEAHIVDAVACLIDPQLDLGRNDLIEIQIFEGRGRRGNRNRPGRRHWRGRHGRRGGRRRHGRWGRRRLRERKRCAGKQDAAKSQ
jgi:hypothetical protein